MPRFSPEFLDELRGRLRPSDVIGRHVKLTRRGNAYWGLSPFKKEKTPSFSVDDNRQSYHCFATGNHGDIIKFLMETQGLSFVESVERLAQEAGLEIPKTSEAEAKREEQRKGLVEACEAASTFFRSQLRRSIGRKALDYLHGRNVSDDLIETFRLGYAPGDRTALKDYLINKGFLEATLVEAGLIIKPDEGGASYDRFRNRVMFPILGARDAVIAFGGRALDADARAKYLNSPETPLFHKGDVLYNFSAARAASAGSGNPLIVCEGYMDVIALSGAGFATATAPLGTALTENQLALLWRQSAEPVLCFDGDAAGLGAAFRSIDRALPLLKPGKSLQFAFLPQGQDPDDLIRASGAPAFASVLAKAQSLADVLWRRETEAQPLDTPERRAALRARLREMVKGIADRDVRQAYGADLAGRLQGLFAPPRRPAETIQRGAGGGRPTVNRRGKQDRPVMASGVLKAKGAPNAWRREAGLVLAAVRCPGLVEKREEAFMSLNLTDPSLDALLKAVLGALLADGGLDSGRLTAHLQQCPEAETLQRILSDETLTMQKFLRPGAELNEVDLGWSDALRHHLLATSARRELSESAAQSFTDGPDGWKAAVLAREELVNSGALSDRLDEAGEKRGEDLADRLEKMRASVASRGRGAIRE
jgi:DNA primase